MTTLNNTRWVFVLLVLTVGLGGCGTKKRVTHRSTEAEPSNVAMPLGSKNGMQSPEFNDELIEAFILEEEQSENPFATPAQSNPVLAQSQLDFAWEDHAVDQKQVVYFDYDSASLKKEQQDVIVADIKHKKELANAGHTIVCKGHACRYHGTNDYNLALSKSRAEQIADFYEKMGIDRHHIKTFGVGNLEADMSVALTEKDQGLNRKVEIYIEA